MKRSSLDLEDDEFLAAFEGGHLSAPDFPHRAHLRLAWLYVVRYGPDVAVDRVAGGIRGLATSHGHPQLYHDTLTRVWVHLVAAAVAAGPAASFELLIEAHPELLDKELPLKYYSANLLWSQEARDHDVAPDVRALPRRAGLGRADRLVP